MKNNKKSLKDLKVNSFVTSIKCEEINTLKGGEFDTANNRRCFVAATFAESHCD